MAVIFKAHSKWAIGIAAFGNVAIGLDAMRRYVELDYAGASWRVVLAGVLIGCLVLRGRTWMEWLGFLGGLVGLWRMSSEGCRGSMDMLMVTVFTAVSLCFGRSIVLGRSAPPTTATAFQPISRVGQERDGSGPALPLTFYPASLPVLVVGSNRLAATRASTFLEAKANVTILGRVPVSAASRQVQELAEAGKVSYTQCSLPDTERDWRDVLLTYAPALICVTDTLISTPERRQATSASLIYHLAISFRIPINISDYPQLSTFTFPSTHRFPGTGGGDQEGNLVVAVTTNGQGCRMSGRVKREIVARLGKDVGKAVDNIGKLRAKAKAQVFPSRLSEDDYSPLNSPVPQISSLSLSRTGSCKPFLEKKPEMSDEDQQLTRMRWVYQMSEYYSFEHLAAMTEEEMDKALELWDRKQGDNLSHHSEEIRGQQKSTGRILLVGSGPGHPGLLTMAAHQALKKATLILSDKLVPSEILALIPSTTQLHIAKKFPGNAEGAQNEMMLLALEGARKGETVVRLKQGDPFVYGRGGEEVLYFREHGFESTVIPGISSALAAPLMMGIPVTQRGVAESLVLCTGVGRQGKAVQLPGYVKSRSLVILMGVARIAQIVSVLTSSTLSGRDGAPFPGYLPIAVIERASSPDQRVILSTLDKIEEALREVDERPPGMMLVGWAALALEGKGRVNILDCAVDREEGIVEEWLAEDNHNERRWKVREGLDEVWKGILNGVV
ncbi:uroporphyrinogen-III C-methyltransferase [Cryptococcus depauperatus]